MSTKNTNLNNQNVSSGGEAKTGGSISHAVSILLCLSQGVHTVSEIARECGLGKSTVHRVLKLLEATDMVVQDRFNRNYYLGSLIARLNSNPLTSHEYLVIFAFDEMKRLSALSGETVTLDVLIGMELVSIYEMSSEQDLKVTERETTTAGLHTGASRKVLLSELPDGHLKYLLDTISYAPITDRSVTDRNILEAQIKAIRSQKYAISYGERNLGVVCISAPLYNYAFPAALSLIGPEVRLEPQIKSLIAEVKKAGETISGKLEEYAIKTDHHVTEEGARPDLPRRKPGAVRKKA